MKQLFKKLLDSCKGAMNITGVVVDVALVVALIPIIKTFISDAANLTASETALLTLATLFIVIGLIVMIGRQTGLIKGK